MTPEQTAAESPFAVTAGTLLRQREPFLRWLEEWYGSLRPLSWQAEMAEQQLQPEEIAVISVDMVCGFCTHEGALASPRIRAIIPNVIRLMQTAHDLGVRHFVLAQDTHTADTPEFKAFPPHCLVGTTESDMVPEFRELPFAPLFAVVPKDSLSIAIGTRFGHWMAEHPELREFFVVGNCTDLCVYQAAMHLRLWANAMHVERRVVVPADCVETYDLPVETARQLGALPHDGDLLHRLFLYHLALNGITIVRGVNP